MEREVNGKTNLVSRVSVIVIVLCMVLSANVFLASPANAGDSSGVDSPPMPPDWEGNSGDDSTPPPYIELPMADDEPPLLEMNSDFNGTNPVLPVDEEIVGDVPELISTPIPDLIVSKMKLSEDAVPVNTELKIHVFLENIGIAYVENAEVAYYLDEISPDSLLAAEDVYFENFNAEMAVSLPMNTLGEHTLWAVIDPHNAITEEQEDNNQNSVNVRVVSTDSLIEEAIAVTETLKTETTDRLGTRGRMIVAQLDFIEGRLVASRKHFAAGRTENGIVAVNTAMDMALLVNKEYESAYLSGKLSENEASGMMLMTGELIKAMITTVDCAVNVPLSYNIAAIQQTLAEIMVEGSTMALGNVYWGKIYVRLGTVMGHYQLAMLKLARGQDADEFLDKADAELEKIAEDIEAGAAEGVIPQELADWAIEKIVDARFVLPPDLVIEPADISMDQIASVGKASLLTITVRNVGGVDANGVTVTVYDETENIEIGTATIDTVPNGGDGETHISWTPTKSGTHYIRASADLGEEIIEMDKSNNEARNGFYVVKGTTYLDSVYIPPGLTRWDSSNASIDDTVVVSGDIIVDGVLLIDGITVVMNCTSDNEYMVWVNPSGKIDAMNTNLTSISQTKTYSVLIGGALDLYLSRVQWVWGDTSYDYAPGGIQLYNDNIFIIGSEIFEGKTHGIYVYEGVSPSFMSGNLIRDNGVSGVCYDRTAGGTLDDNIIRNSTYGVYCYRASPTIEDNVEISGNSDSGIYCEQASPTISGNIIISNYHGIQFKYASSASVTNNVIEMNSEYGIRTREANPVILNNPSISNSTYGIYAFESSPTVDGNAFFNNAQVGVMAHTSSSLITRNTLLGNPNYSVENYLSPAGGLVASENTIRDSFCGFYSYGSSGRVVNNPEIADNSYGIYLQESPGYVVENNVIDSHTHYGILANQSEWTSVRNCSMANNSWGVYFRSSSHSSVSDNCTIIGENGTYATNSHDIIIRDSTIKECVRGSITFSTVTFSIIDNCTVKNNYWGIFITTSSHNIEVRDCTVTSNKVFGVYFLNVNDTSITDSTLEYNDWGAWGALHIRKSRDCTVDSCQLRYNGNGTPALIIDISTNITIKNNVFEDNHWINLYVGPSTFGYDGWKKQHYDHDIDTSNIVNGKPVYYFFDQKNQAIENLVGGHFTFAWCENITVKNCESVGRAPAMGVPASVSDPIYLVFTNDSKVEDCTGNRTTNGLWLDNVNNISVNNFIGTYAYWAGLCIESSSNCSLSVFEARYSPYGVKLLDSENVRLRHGIVYLGKHQANYTWYTMASFTEGIRIESTRVVTLENCTSTACRGGGFVVIASSDICFDECISGIFQGFIIQTSVRITLENSLSLGNSLGISVKTSTEVIVKNHTAQNCINSVSFDTVTRLAVFDSEFITDKDNAVGIRIQNSVDAVLENCNIEEHRWGVLVRASSNITVSKTTVVFGGPGLPGSSPSTGISYGIDIGDQTSDVHVVDCRVTSNHYAVLFQDSTSNCTIHNTTMADSNYSALYLISSKLEAHDLTITGSNQTAIQSYGSVLNITNSSISATILYDFYMDTGSNITTLNTTFNKVRVQYIDTDSTLTVRWFMYIHVVLPDLSPIVDASVEVIDVNDNPVFTGISDVDGKASWIKCTEYIQTSTITTFYSPYNVSASRWTMQAWALPEPPMERSSDVYVVLGGNGYNLFLHKGWNLVSLPYETYAMETNIPAILKSIEGKPVIVRWYNTTDIADPWKVYRPSGTANDLTHVNYTMGLWVQVTEPCTLVVTGSVPDPQPAEIQLYAGWNLVGYPSATPRTFSDALAGTSADMVSVYDGTNPSLIRDIPLPSDGIMSMGNGYWVRVTEDCVWTVDW